MIRFYPTEISLLNEPKTEGTNLNNTDSMKEKDSYRGRVVMEIEREYTFFT